MLESAGSQVLVPSLDPILARTHGASAGPAGSAVTQNGRAAVLGSPVSHSLSPVLHEAAYASLGLTGWTFSRFDVGGHGDFDLGQFLNDLVRDRDGQGKPWRGFAVTMPLKESALALASVATRRAHFLGAANTLIRLDDAWAADNTDVVGVREALRDYGVVGPTSAVVIGSGATARAALGALSDLGLQRVVLAVRSRVRPETIAVTDRLGLAVQVVDLAHGASLFQALTDAQVTVSALPHGTTLQLPSVAAGTLAGRVLLDVTYGGWPSPLAAWALAAGAEVISGLPMLLHQAVEQVRLMTAGSPDVATMRAALMARTGPLGW